MRHVAFCSLLIFLSCSGAPVQEGAIRGSAGGYTIVFPQKWKIVRPDDVTLEAVSEDELAGVRIVEQGRIGKSAEDILGKIEKQLEMQNSLPESSRTLDANLLKESNAQHCAIGQYALRKNGVLLRRKIWVFVKGQRAFVITTNVPESYAGEYPGVFEGIIKSLRAQ
jgi:hypothetical protein